MGCPSWTSATIRLVARCASARKLPSARTASSISTVKPALAGAFTARDFLILTSFLQSRYAQDKPLALSARITFEQSYGEKILMAPHKQGFNWVGWIAPFAAVGTGAVVVGALIRRWGRRAAELRTVSPVPIDASADEMARLDAAVRGEDR